MQAREVNFAEDILRTIDRVARALDQAHARWAIGGSLASAVHGEPRSTNDVDFVAGLRGDGVDRFVAALGPDFFAVREAIMDAVAAHASFNVIDDETMVKIDVFVPPPGALGLGQLARRRRVELIAGFEVFVLGPEDTVLQKLRWYELGGRVSDRQWRDICGVLRTSHDRLDDEYLAAVAGEGGFGELLDLARAAARVDA